MDALSDVLAAIQTGRPASARTTGRAPWGVRQCEPGTAQFHVLIRGRAWLLLAGGRPPLPLGPGDVVLLPRGVEHVLADDPATVPVDLGSIAARHPADRAGTAVELGAGGAETVMLCGAYLLDLVAPPHPLLRSLPDVLHLPASRGTGADLRAAVDLLAAEVERPRPGSTAIVEAMVAALFAMVLRAWCEQNGQDCPEWLAALADPALGAVLTAIHAEVARPWTVAGLAAVAGLSRAAFARRFTALVGMPPLAYVTQWRMVRAQHLLRTSPSALEVLAEQVGYDSAFAFSKAFKRYLGVSPGRYRSEHRVSAAG